MNKKRLLAIALTCTVLAGISGAVNAQERERGRLTGSFETNSMYYIPDSDLDGYLLPQDRIGSNNYLKVDYTQGRLAIGVEFELYAPVLYGYESGFEKGKLTGKYVSWTDKDFNVTVGNFYEQFGSGMVLRSFEDRALGFNNSLEGARIGYNYKNIVRVKGLVGRPRMFMDYADVWIRGADASFAISELAGWNDNYLALEGSFVNRYEKLPADATFGSPNTDFWSGRIAYEHASGFFFKGEYVERGSQLDINVDYVSTRGKGYLTELGYNGNGLGVAVTLRRVDSLSGRIQMGTNNTANIMNYIPAMTRQYTYMLTNLEPHNVLEQGEQGAQADIFYNFRKGTYMGGRYGMKVRLNGSIAYALHKGSNDKYNPIYAEAGIDVDKQWTKKFKTSFLYWFQRYDPNKDGSTNQFNASHVLVADMLYKFNTKTSLRWEVQYLYSNDGEKDWIAGLIEANFAPKWSVYASDMYNLGNDDKDKRTHYYNAGVSFTQSRTRIALSFGRNRAGYICSGGVCRMTPAYTGVNLSFTTSF